MSDQDLSKELECALQEQTFGIEGYEIRSSPFQHAAINLLEKATVYVQVTTKGWKTVIPEQPKGTGLSWLPGPSSDVQRVFETLDDLLRDQSPLYRQQEAQRLMEKLSALAARV